MDLEPNKPQLVCWVSCVQNISEPPEPLFIKTDINTYALRAIFSIKRHDVF